MDTAERKGRGERRPMGRMGLMVGLVASVVGAAERPAPLVLLADDAEYKAAKAMETVVEGVLERTPSSGTLGGPPRFNPYRLLLRDGTGKTLTRELYVGPKAPLLAVHVGQRVRVVGKLVAVEVDKAKRLELWPARLEALSDALAHSPGEDGVYARCTWQPAGALKRGTQFFVFRDGGQLARALNLQGATAAEAATSQLARQLRVPSLDWSKHMLVTVSAGLHGPEADRLVVTRVATEEQTLTIFYKLDVSGPGPAPGFGYPAQTVLLDRFAGTVKIAEEKPVPAPKKAD